MCTHIHVPQYTQKHEHMKMEKEEEREIPCYFTNLKSQSRQIPTDRWWPEAGVGGGELMFNRDDFSLGR